MLLGVVIKFMNFNFVRVFVINYAVFVYKHLAYVVICLPSDSTYFISIYELQLCWISCHKLRSFCVQKLGLMSWSAYRQTLLTSFRFMNFNFVGVFVINYAVCVYKNLGLCHDQPTVKFCLLHFDSTSLIKASHRRTHDLTPKLPVAADNRD